MIMSWRLVDVFLKGKELDGTFSVIDISGFDTIVKVFMDMMQLL